MRCVASVVLLACGLMVSPALAREVSPPAGAAAEPPVAPAQTTPVAAEPQSLPPPPPKKKKIVRRAAPNERGVVGDDPQPTFTPETLQLILGGAERYREIARTGGWPTLPSGTRLTIGMKGPAVLALRHRLAAEGDLGPEAVSELPFDKHLADAVRRFQSRHGLARTGIASGATLAALNVPAEERARQLQMSAARLGASNFAFGQRYVVVNLPSASVEAIENGAVRKRYVAVVGKPSQASPVIEARIGAVNLNPTWTLPVSIVRNEMVPKMQRDPTALAKQKIRILDGRGTEIDPASIDWSSKQPLNYTYRQDSGVGNALGQIRIDMPNREAVYMHDTPSKKYFSAQDRFFSHGCVRVQDVKGFAAWLLEDQSGGWDVPMIEAAIAMGDRRDIRLPRPVPVAWVYLTGYVTPDGKAHFRDDIYGLDRMEAAVAAARRPATGQPQNAAMPAPVQQIDPMATGSIPRGIGRLR